MSGHPQGAQYEEGYTRPQGGQEQDSYYQDEQYGQYHDDQHQQQRGQPGYQDQPGDAYYDESYVYIKHAVLALLTNNLSGLIMTVSKARLQLRAKGSIRKMAITMIAANSLDISKTSITTINITTKAVRRLGTIKTGMHIFRLKQ